MHGGEEDDECEEDEEDEKQPLVKNQRMLPTEHRWNL
jgi:hypothetical protein